MVTKKQALNHNRTVVADVSAVLLENHIVDPFAFLEDQEFAAKMIQRYINAANKVRPMMGLPKLFLYNMEEF